MMLTHSEQINEIAAALAKAQGEMENASKNAANPHFKSRYADLAEILNVVRPALARHGIALTQAPTADEGVVTVETMLTHASGQWMRSSCSARIGKSDPQGIGSATTYLRRYSLAAMCGIAQEDDDGEGAKAQASAGARQGRREDRSAAPERERPTAKQAAFIRNLIASHVFSEQERAAIERQVEAGFKGSVSSAIDRIREQMEERKAAEMEEAADAEAMAGAGAADDDSRLPF